MSAEILSAIQSLRVVNDLVQAHRSFRNFNELIGAVAEVNAKLAAAWSVALTSQEKQATLTDRIGKLEKEIGKLKDWKREAKRYQLTALTPDTFAYMLKPGMERDETPHKLCAHCFTQGEKAILQADTPGPKVYAYHCPRCQNDIRVATRPLQVRTSRG